MSNPFPKTQKNVYSVPFLATENDELVLWFFTGSKCNLECTHCYVESGPRANKHPFLQFQTFKKGLDDARNYRKLEIYFTGGEPFINPEFFKILEEALKNGNTTVLTNLTRIDKKRANKLSEIQEKSKYELTLRVSLEGPNADSNDTIRGKNAFEKARDGLNNLVNVGFNPIVTVMRSWPDSKREEMISKFQVMLEKIGIPKENQRLKILPPLRIGREAIRNQPYTEKELFTDKCFLDYDYNNIQCSKCRIVSENGIWVCPILINEDGARMGSNLTEATRPFPMKYMVCWTCRMEGMSCTND
jgi:MoaA/NifB/PqqE/SkfB family radical SAM enzyme